jgi:hypothetical protein
MIEGAQNETEFSMYFSAKVGRNYWKKVFSTISMELKWGTR